MRLSELAAALSVRFKLTGAERDPWMDDLKFLGVREGIALQDAWDRCRASWKYQRAPRPPEFREFYAPVKSGQVTGSLQMVWRQIRKPAEQFARDHLVHVQLMQSDDHSITLWPLCPTARRWWEQPDHAAEVGRLIGRDVTVMGRET